ncbi:MAG: transporter substrate-binding domain-containing protein [Pseudomonadota bacterium]|nr:transporter substrate-binding domain-containing protein [Pseudomonadota bacterium]
MRAVFKFAAASLIAMVIGAGAAMADIKYGVAAEPYPPFTSKDASGKWVGWEVDLIDAVCKHINEKCELVEVAWDGIIPALTSKQIDLIWSSMSITAERKKTIDFSSMYYDPASVIIGAKNGDLDISPEHLKGKTIGTQISTTHERYAQKYFGAGSEVKTYQTQDEANNDLAAGRLDYVQADGGALDAFLKTDQGKACCELKSTVPEDAEVLGEGVGAGIRKEDTALKEKIDGAIAALAASGELVKITEKYPDLKAQLILPSASQ